MTVPRAHILGIPRELRDMIYLFYVQEPGGYVYSPESGKLRAVNRKLIDTALALSCRQVSEELRGLALQKNNITFYPVRSSRTAFLFERVLANLRYLKEIVLNVASHEINPHLRERVAQEFPQARVMLSMITDPAPAYGERILDAVVSSSRPWGLAPSQHRAISDRLLELASCNPAFDDAAAYALQYQGDIRSLTTFRSLLSLQPILWSLPTRQDVDEMAKICPPCEALPIACDPRTNIYFSASAAAHKFLTALSEPTRMSMRQIRLCETRRSVAYPECHALGLVRFCVENTRLRITREVDMFRSVFPIYGGIKNSGWDDVPYLQGIASHLHHSEVTGRIVPWLEEASILTSAGMPIDSYSLVFLAPPFECQQVLDLLAEAAKWQDAVAEASQRGRIAPVQPLWENPWPCCRTVNFARIVESVINKRSFVRFEGATGVIWNMEALLEQAYNWSELRWSQEYESMQSQNVQFKELPSWLDIQREYLAQDMENPDSDVFREQNRI
ncbi:hypothetical protein BDV96DRAFT_574212 [Lophiotrema nucula]|uniref:Uncharacterized protein n=1 Tax=Lophiotrema nucula TaxID=690887 RepID=A0A6A5Z8U3_9PLEO|nr:hypothetical protein BDV96DRAFT_574212 [Lophiotrema nucula]